MHLRCFVADTPILETLAEPQDLPSVGDVCVLPLPDGAQRFRVRRLVRTYGFARALAGMDCLDLARVDVLLEEEGEGDYDAID
jgi:hypothetical protein